MFSAVLGLFSQDLAVDLGSCRTRVHLRGAGIVCDEPTVVAVRSDRDGRRSVIGIGEEALPMLGRTPADIDATRPIRNGRVADFEVAEAFLLHVVRRIHGRNGWMRPRMVVPVPHHASDMEVRAVRDSCEAAGAREVHLVPRPLAAAIGVGLPVEQPSGYLVVDIGGGITEVSILSLNGVVSCHAVPAGGTGHDEAIVTWLRETHGLLVGQPTAEALKIELGAAHDPRASTAWVKGRCLRRGVPRAVQVDAVSVYEALKPQVSAIAGAIRTALEQAPPELASDVVDHGVVLCGGGSQLHGLDRALRTQTGLAVVHAEDPTRSVVSGAGRILEELDLLEAMAC